MSVATAIHEAMSLRGFTQARLAAELHLTRSAVSMIAIGERLAPAAVAPMLARTLDDGPLCMELGRAAAGGAGPMLYDGPDVDQHCLCRSEDAVIEMAEAIAVMERSRRALAAGGMSADQAELWENEAADAAEGLLNALARHCRKTGRSYCAVWDRQRAHNETRGYVAREPRRLARTA